MAKKRGGRGGNASRDPRGNLEAQEAYRNKFGKSTKACTGLLHRGQSEIDVSQFRQSKNNKATGLQSRCDLCNRLYFSVQQKPIKRIAAAAIYLADTEPKSWLSVVPESLRGAVGEVVRHYASTECQSKLCELSQPHGSFRASAALLTQRLSGIDRLKSDSFITDNRTGEEHPAPQILHDLQVWAAAGGTLWETSPTSAIWKWWQNQFDGDAAYCSREEQRAKEDSEFDLIAHPIADFAWGAGNIKDTIQGHSVPALNQVRASASLLPPSGSSHGRAYGFLCEGDHLAMIDLSENFKSRGLSLGHTPAPLRWLGKNDPINAVGELLDENIRKRDSLVELHQIAVRNPQEGAKFVSWQIRDQVIALGASAASPEGFAQALQAAVEEYFDSLADALLQGDETSTLADLRRACPGLTGTVYSYRLRKVREWLLSRPGYSDSRSN